MERNILLLGNPELYEVSEPVAADEWQSLPGIVRDLHDTLFAFRAEHGRGRAIAAPQIGVRKRIIYMHIHTPMVFVNPVLIYPDDRLMEVMDDCMSFPGLFVKVLRHERCIIRCQDAMEREAEMGFTGELAELLQHEYDHLDGILATMRAMDDKSFYAKGWDYRDAFTV